MSDPTVVEYCQCPVPKAVFDDETKQNICSACGGVINDSQRVIVNLSMLKIGDKIEELIELNKYQAEQIQQLKKTIMDWADALTTPCHWENDVMVHTDTCTCGTDYDEWSDNQL